MHKSSLQYNYTEQNVIAIIVKKIMNVLTIHFKERRQNWTKGKWYGYEFLPACLSSLCSILTEERWIQNSYWSV